MFKIINCLTEWVVSGNLVGSKCHNRSCFLSEQGNEEGFLRSCYTKYTEKLAAMHLGVVTANPSYSINVESPSSKPFMLRQITQHSTGLCFRL